MLGVEKAVQSVTEFAGGERLLDHLEAVLVGTADLLDSRRAAPQQQNADFGPHANHATRQLEATHASEVGTGDQRIDLERRRPADRFDRRSVCGGAHPVPSVAESLAERNAVVGIVVDQKHEAARERRGPEAWAECRQGERRVRGRGEHRGRSHQRHRRAGPAVGSCAAEAPTGAGARSGCPSSTSPPSFIDRRNGLLMIHILIIIPSNRLICLIS